MGRGSLVTAGVIAAALAVTTSASGKSSPIPPLDNLAPGAFLDAHQHVPVTVVFVGLEEGADPTRIDVSRFFGSQLRSAPIVDRTTRFYEQSGITGLEPSRLGLTYDYTYRSVFADASFEDGFFAYVRSIALGPIPGGTIYQQAYSLNPLAAQHIPASYIVDAKATEAWLASHAGPLLGVDTTKPTVFLVNWFGRPDFVFHTYGFLEARPGWPFPTGFTQGGQMIAFGGSPPDGPYGALGRLARVWFYDVSAGPEYQTANWALDIADFNADGIAEDRIPPVWEYGTSHWFRPFASLSDDLAKLLRFVAVDSLFGASPLYDPALSEPLLADNVEVDLNLFGAVPGRDPRSLLRLPDIPASLSRLDPTRTFTLDTRSSALDGALAAAFDCQQSAFGPTPHSCFGLSYRPDPGNPLYDLDVYFLAHQNQYLEGTRYEVPVAAFDIPDSRVFPDSIVGLASSRPPNLQGWAYVWMTELARTFLANDDTGAIVHETGHHLGLSHPHDAYDAGFGSNVFQGVPQGPFWFMRSGDESNTTMSYLPNTSEFSQFDRDNIARWQIAARLDNANRILGDIARSPKASQAAAQIVAADAKAGQALAALEAWNIPGANQAAADAYHLVLDAAAQANVHVEPWSGVADQKGGRGVLAAATDPRNQFVPMPKSAQPGSSSAPFRP